MNVKRIDNIILEVLEEFKQPILESAMNWADVKDLLSSNNIFLFTNNGIEVGKYSDPELGTIYIQSDGNAEIESIKKVVPWVYNKQTSTLSVNNKKLELRKREKLNTDSLTQREKEKQETDKNQALDIFQTILDWAGFIPGYGDILDAINAIIYFMRGKQLEGYLSLIAVVPVVGSGLKLAFKGVIQSIGGSIAFSKILKQAQKGNVTGLADFYRIALDSGKLNKVQLAKLAEYGDEVAKLLVSGKAGIAKLEQALKMDPNTLRGIYKQIDDMSLMVRNTTSIPVKQSFKIPGGKLIKKGLSTVGKKAGKLASTGLNLVTFGGFGIARNIVKKLGITKKDLNQLRKAMDVKFVKQVENSTLLTTSMFKQMKRPSSAQAVADLGVPPWLWSKQTKDIDAWFDNLKKTDPLKWKQVSNNIAKSAMSVQNPYYVKMASNYFQQAGNIFKPGAVFAANKGDVLGSLVKLDTYRLSNPKSLDVVANEIEDLAEKLGLDPQDDANSVIVSALYLSVMELVKEYEEYIPTAVGAAAIGASVTDTIGLTDFGTDTKDAEKSIPGGKVITVSDDLVKIKDDFKSVDGTTSQRLEALKQKGYSESQIMNLKRELDID